MKKVYWVTVIAVTGLMFACNKDDDDDNNPHAGTFYGNTVKVGDGTARSFITHVDEHDKMQLGITLNAAALNNLPLSDGEFEIDLPEQAKTLTPFDHITLGWMSNGHVDPTHIYEKPHFDVHFYMITRTEQHAIVTGAKMDLLPGPEFIPPNYIPEPGPGVPMMGRHWADLSAPEWQPMGPSFTTTFIIGSYDSKVIFWEPMITREFLLSKPDTVINIPQPEKFPKQSHFPTKYEIRFDEQKQEYNILLAEFEHR